jgi:hypothetical protein
MLLTISQTADQIQVRQAATPDGGAGSNFKAPNLTAQNIVELEAVLKVALPKSFPDLLTRFRFGGLSIGGVFFGRFDRYDEYLVTMNAESQFPWWGGGERPGDLVLIAGTDGYVVLLDVKTGRILAYDRNGNWTEAEEIASSFETFVRAAARVWFEESIPDPMAFADLLSREAGGISPSRFWSDRTRGVR